MGVLKLFGLFFAINLFTIGGGYVMLPILHGYFVDQYGLLTNREFGRPSSDSDYTPVRHAVPSIDLVPRSSAQSPYGEIETKRRNGPNDQRRCCVS